jgi:hypothetical protein
MNYLAHSAKPKRGIPEQSYADHIGNVVQAAVSNADHVAEHSGCKAIFNQRMKQSGMRWSKGGGQSIVDLRTACRSR